MRPTRRTPARRKRPDWLGKLRCPACGHLDLVPLPARSGDWGAWGLPGLRCPGCQRRYPVESGVLTMIPEGDLARYAYWEKMHAAHDPAAIVTAYRRSFSFRQRFLETYYCLPRISRRLGWDYEDAVELGCGWGVYTLSLVRSGRLQRPWLLDISSSALSGTRQVFRAFGLEPFLVRGEIHNLPFRDGAFDLSLSGGLYEHFVGAEQEALVLENCRVSRRVLCQVPESSLAYWTYRRLVTWKLGCWPFGFEEPLSRRRLRELYEGAGARVMAWDFHNLASAVVFGQARKHPWLSALAWRPGLLWLLRHDAVLAAETGR